MDKKVSNERDQSTEQLFSLGKRNGKQLENAEEQINRAGGNEEELFLQNVFLDKSANSSHAPGTDPHTDSGEQGIAWGRGMPGADASDSAQQAVLEQPGRSHSPHAESQAGIGLNEHALEKNTRGNSALDATRGHAIRLDDATGAGSNHPSVSAAQQGITTQDNSVILTSTDLLPGLTETDGDKLQVTGVSVDADYGTITANADGSWTFTPAADHQGEDLPLSVTVSDGTTSTISDTNLDISQVNDRPADGGVNMGDTTTDSPAPSGTDSSTDPQSNAIDIGEDKPAVTDESVASGQGPDTVSISGSDLPPPIPVNTGPTVGAVDLGSTAEDTATTFSSSELLANASDIDGDDLQVTAVAVDPAHGNVSDNGDGSWTFNPAADYHGEDVPLSFTVSDGTDSTQGSASLAVSAANDGPTVGAVDLGSTAEDTATTFSSSELLANASDIDGDDLQVTAVAVDPAHGNVSDNGDGSWTFNPAADYHGEDVPLSFTVSDGTDSTQGSASLAVSAANDGPTVGAVDLGSTAEDTATTFSSSELLANASDIDGDDLQVTAVAVDPAHGNVSDNGDGSWTFNPAADYHGEDVPLSFTVSDGTDSTQGSASLDVVAQAVEGIELDGTRGSDTLVGTAGDDTFNVAGNGGLDQIDGGEGNDTIQGSRYGDTIMVSDNLDNIQNIENIDGGAGYDILQGGSGNDTLDLSDGPALSNIEEIDGGYGDDTIIGTAGNDTIEGNRGNDTLAGGGGDDTFKVAGNAGLDQMDGGEGNDTIQGSRYGDTIMVSDNLDNIQNIENIDGGAGYDVLQGGSGNDTLDLSDGPALSNIEEIDGGYGDDTIIGTAGNDTIEGNRGNDTLAGGGGDDTFKVAGNAGLDQMDGGEGNDTIQGSRYGDTIMVSDNLDNIQNIENIDGGAGYDVLQGGSGNDTLDLSNGPALSNIEEIDGGYGDDTIIGTAGNDTIEGNRGNDTLAGGGGDDTFKVAGNAGLDQMDGGEGNDTIQGSRYGDTIMVSDNLDNIQNIENIDGGAGYDVLQGGSGNDTLDLSNGPALSNIEEIDGGYGDDTIIGTAGNDTIEGNRGNDTLAGGGGDDTFKVAGNAGLDQMDGGEGNDTIQGSRYGDTIMVSDNLDNIQNIENIDGGAGYDVLQGGSGNDTLDFSNGPALSNIEEIDGGYGDDTIIGTAGNDTIEGNRGNDTLAGGGGDDILDGGYGTDTLILQGFRNQYQINQNDESGYTITDTVEDRDGSDTIDNFELVQFQDQTSSVEDLLNPVEPEPAAAAEISGEEPLDAMDAGAGAGTDQEWVGSAQTEDTDAGVSQDGALESQVATGDEAIKGNNGNHYGNQGNNGNNGNNGKHIGTSGEEQLPNSVEAEPTAAAEISGEELLYAMDAGTGPETGQGWAESVQAEETDSGVPQESAWDSLADAGQEEAALAATAMDLTPDTSGVIAMTEGANNGLEGLEALEV